MTADRQVVAIIQARMASTRLPGKVLEDIHGLPMLARVVERARRAQTLDRIVVATTTDPSDQPVADLCEARDYPFYRGHPTDVLDRYLQAARTFKADVIVRLTGDCPLIDPAVIDQTVRAFLDAEPPLDFATNRYIDDRTFPIGLDTEVCSASALQRAWEHGDQPHHREHVMPYLYEVDGRFRTLHVRTSPSYGSLRWTVDSRDDLAFVRQVYASFGGRDDFSWLDVLKTLEAHPELARLNAAVRRKDLTEVDERWHR
ncbi:MAG TPA: glycosyltransferase family protein [Anaerolineales bacterium]|nr:glycosyltransferase family protein [Anaerolineales bacterium]